MNVQLSSSFFDSDSFLTEAGDAECGRAWKAMHRALSNGSLDPQAGSYPLNHVVLGGNAAANEGGGAFRKRARSRCATCPLRSNRSPSRRFATFRERYLRIEPDEHTPEGNCQYTWRRLQDVKEFYRETAEEGLGAVVITRVKRVNIRELERNLKPPIDSDLLNEVISFLEGQESSRINSKGMAVHQLRKMGPAAKSTSKYRLSYSRFQGTICNDDAPHGPP